MRKNLWKAVAVTVVLALGTMAMSALAESVTKKSAPCPVSAGKAAPAEMKGCAMHGAATAEMKGCAAKCATAADMKCCANCPHLKAGKCCCPMHAKAGKAGCAMAAKEAACCPTHAKLGKGHGARAGSAMHARGCDCGMLCGKPDCPVHGKAAAGRCAMQAKDKACCPMHAKAAVGCCERQTRAGCTVQAKPAKGCATKGEAEPRCPMSGKAVESASSGSTK